MLSQHALQVVSQHALQRGVCSQWGCLVGGMPAAGGSAPGEVVPGGGCLVQGVPGLGRVPDPGGAWSGQTPPGRDGYCCGRYASNWNAFLFQLYCVMKFQFDKTLHIVNHLLQGVLEVLSAFRNR